MEKRCKTCIYRGKSEIGCEYILIKGHSRGCEPGSKCIRYKRGARKRERAKMMGEYEREFVSGKNRKERTATYNGETHTLAEWAEIVGGKESTMTSRFYNGWADEEIIYGRGGKAAWEASKDKKNDTERVPDQGVFGNAEMILDGQEGEL